MLEGLHAQKLHVVGTYYKPTIDLTELSNDIKLVEVDVRYPQSVEWVISKYKPDRIFHLAAQSYPSVSWERPYETIETNISGTIAVFEAIKKNRKMLPGYDPVVVVACSSAEYGQTLDEIGDVLVDETAQLKPLHPYGVSKVGQDLISFQYYINDNIKCIRARIFNTTGTRKVNDVTSDYVRRIVRQMKTGRKTNITLRVGNIETRRAIMDVRDLVNALLLLSEKGHYGEVYNICSEYVYQVKDIIKKIEDTTGLSFSLNVDPHLLRPTDERLIAGDISKLKRDTSWTQEVTLIKTIQDMIAYWMQK
jgi:nucleoside-diphosphate-sugar epimerase